MPALLNLETSSYQPCIERRDCTTLLCLFSGCIFNFRTLNTYLDSPYILLHELILVQLSRGLAPGQVLASLTTEKIAMYIVQLMKELWQKYQCTSTFNNKLPG